MKTAILAHNSKKFQVMATFFVPKTLY